MVRGCSQEGQSKLKVRGTNCYKAKRDEKCKITKAKVSATEEREERALGQTLIVLVLACHGPEIKKRKRLVRLQTWDLVFNTA